VERNPRRRHPQAGRAPKAPELRQPPRSDCCGAADRHDRSWVLSPSSARNTSQKGGRPGAEVASNQRFEFTASSPRLAWEPSRGRGHHQSSPENPLQAAGAAARRPTQRPNSTATRLEQIKARAARRKNQQGPPDSAAANRGAGWSCRHTRRRNTVVKVVEDKRHNGCVRWPRLQPVCHRAQGLLLMADACPAQSAAATGVRPPYSSRSCWRHRQIAKRRSARSAPDRAGRLLTPAKKSGRSA